MALTKAEMAERLFEEVGLNKREAKEFVDLFFDALRESLRARRGGSSRPAQHAVMAVATKDTVPARSEAR